MTWVRLDVNFADHAKVLPLTHAAFRLEVTAILFARRNLTDGHIPELAVPARLAGSIPQLVRNGLWVPSPEGGWVLHDFLDWQESRAEVEDRRKRMSEGGRRGARKRWGTG